MHKKFSLSEIGLEAEIGKYARQAHGSVWLTHGDNRVLSTVVAADEPKDFLGFFPLSVEYRERPSSAGKFPGGYIKREGRLSDVEVLTSRLIDRPIRPLFPQDYFNEVQIISTVHSSDGSFPSRVMALIGASLALTLSEIPFLGPIGATLVAKIDGEWKFYPSHEELKQSDTSVVVAGTERGICMVEGNCNDLLEAELVALFDQAHAHIKKQVEWQKNIAKEVGVSSDKKHEGRHDFAGWLEKVTQIITEQDLDALWATSKKESSDAMSALKQKVLDSFADDVQAGAVSNKILLYVFELFLKKKLPDLIAVKGKRMDGRALDVVRPIEVEVGTLPCAHGSAFFQRGETQAIASVTLGTGQDVQKVEKLIGDSIEKTFMLHYNFPPFSVGEVRPMRSVGRREIGHGYLAEHSFTNVLPSEEEFPYTVRSVVDILESNGSSSQASVCATMMALMDAGVPIKGIVSGIAMGLMQDAEGKLHVITDITGTEDAFGLMDLKVAGTEKGIMSFQLDIKDKAGLSQDILAKALEAARVARLHIRGEMAKVLDQPRTDLSASVPRITTMKVPTEKIGAIIGPGGSTIKEIIAETGAQIDIEDDGTVKIFAKNAEGAAGAEAWIKNLTKVVEVGSTYLGTVRRITNFGIFVELFPGKDGLVHIATIAKTKQQYLEKLYKQGDKIKVEVSAVDQQGKVRLVSQDLSKQQ